MKWLVLGLLAAWQAQAGTLQSTWTSGSFQSEWGVRNYRLYLPAQKKLLPLVVMVHGCHQTAESFASDTGMNQVAERNGFAVLYPEQDSWDNIENCWNFFFPSNQKRGVGEPAIIVGMVAKLVATGRIDTKRVYVAGLSSGGAMAAILGACYSDVFAAIGVASGLEYESASTVDEAYAAMDHGAALDPRRSAEDAVRCAHRMARPLRALVINGTADTRVNPLNSEQVIKQIIYTNDSLDDGSLNGSQSLVPVSTASKQVPGGYSYIEEHFGTPRFDVEHINVQGMGHAWSGGARAAKYVDRKGPDASLLLWNFFNQ